MHGKVDDPLEFSGATVHTHGPIKWNGEAGDVPVDRMRLLKVTVTQGATSGSVSPNTDYEAPGDHSDGRWAADVKARSGQWVAGPATVVVNVRLWPDSQETTPFEEPPWVETVHLVPA